MKEKETSLEIANTEVPAFLKDKINEPGRGNENVSVDDMTVPRLELIQNMSPCRNKKEPSYIEGAEEGMLYNNVTRELYGEEVYMIFGAFKVEYLLWKDRKQGGGFFGSYPTMEEAKGAIDALGSDGAGVEAQKTHQHYGLIIDKETGRLQPILLSMSRTKEKVSKRLNSVIKMQGGDRFSRIFKVFTVQEQNKSGDSYYNLNFKFQGFVNEPQYIEAEKIYNMAKSGQLQASQDYDDSKSTFEESEEF
jgi:hypothetical protein